MKATIKFLLLIAGALLTYPTVSAQVVKLNSFPTAPATIYLDFDGQYVTGTSWNWSGPINAQPAALSNTAITEIFNRVAEDYRPFNINITTDSVVYLAAPFYKRTRIIITSTSAWYGSAGGVAYVGSFNWGDETPAWIFSTLLNNNTKFIAEACSHEMGHTLGLQHQSSFDTDCKKVAEYSAGLGEGEIGWAPIMGVGYHKNLTTWHMGSSTSGCNFIQNDLEILSGAENGFGYRPDDHGNTPATATTVNILGENFSVKGLINGTGDADEFKITLNTTTVLRLNAIPENVGIGNQGADIDIKVTVLNSNSDTIGSYNPTTLLGVGIDTNLNKGSYYLLVTATANVNHSIYGSLGYYSITGSLVTILPLRRFLLKAKRISSDYMLYWSYVSDEPMKHIIVETSADGKTFVPLVSLDANARNFIYPPLKIAGYYRLKAVTTTPGMYYYSNIISAHDDKESKSVQVLSNVVGNQVSLNSDGAYSYQVFDASGKLSLEGKLVNGYNKIDIFKMPKGIVFMRISNSVGGWTEKLIKR